MVSRWPGIPGEVGVSVAVSEKFRKTTRGERVGITASAKPWPPRFLLPYFSGAWKKGEEIKMGA